MAESQPPMVSIIVPVYNERDNIRPLVTRIFEVMSAGIYRWELIVVDDGSNDGTCDALKDLCRERIASDDNSQLRQRFPMKVIFFRRNFGQTSAIAAGFDHCVGDIIVPIDGDMQNDPADIPRVVRKLQEGYDVVSGWRQNRKDTFITRKIPSWIANYVIGIITGVRLHDYGCSLKAYHRDIIANLKLYGEMHRFIPALASWAGARVTEMVVNHHPRTRGKTKYGLNRTFKVVLDLITIKFLGTFSTRPLHIFGGIGLLSFLSALIIGSIMVYLKIANHEDMSQSPLPILAAMLMMMSIQFLLMGLLAEMLCRTYHESQDKPTYIIRHIIEPETTKTANDSSQTD